MEEGGWNAARRVRNLPKCPLTHQDKKQSNQNKRWSRCICEESRYHEPILTKSACERLRERVQKSDQLSASTPSIQTRGNKYELTLTDRELCFERVRLVVLRNRKGDVKVGRYGQSRGPTRRLLVGEDVSPCAEGPTEVRWQLVEEAGRPSRREEEG